MDTVKAAIEAINSGGYIATCGNAARYRNPNKSKAGTISLKKAKAIVADLEHFACGALWPYADWYRQPQTDSAEGKANGRN
jgi:hypothetical protein